MNHKEKVLKELETKLTRNQNQANVFIYTRSTKDGAELYFRRYGAAWEMNSGAINFEEDCTTDLYDLQEMIEETILQTGNTIYIGIEILEELEELQDPNSDFWRDLSCYIN